MRQHLEFAVASLLVELPNDSASKMEVKAETEVHARQNHKAHAIHVPRLIS
jgi:hypothetical protein